MTDETWWVIKNGEILVYPNNSDYPTIIALIDSYWIDNAKELVEAANAYNAGRNRARQFAEHAWERSKKEGLIEEATKSENLFIDEWIDHEVTGC